MATPIIPTGVIPVSPQWAAPTHRDALIADHGLNPAANPTVSCACGRRVLADVCVDVSLLPMAVRAALGLEEVDYLCDGCRMVLHVHRYLSCETLCTLLGAPADVLDLARSNDAAHIMGMRRRPRELRATHSVVEVAGGAVTGGATLPHLAARMAHADSADQLERAGAIKRPTTPTRSAP